MCAEDILALSSFLWLTGYFLAEKICRLNAREASRPSVENAMKEATARCYEALSLNISVLFCRHHFGIYSACLCTEMGQCSNPVGRAVDSSGFLILAKPWIFDNICHGVLWYLSAMTFAVWTLYPLLRRHYNVIVQAAPMGSLLILGVILQNCGSLDAPCTFLFGWVNTGILRAFAAS